jgi:hypothetical protein
MYLRAARPAWYRPAESRNLWAEELLQAVLCSVNFSDREVFFLQVQCCICPDRSKGRGWACLAGSVRASAFAICSCASAIRFSGKHNGIKLTPERVIVEAFVFPCSSLHRICRISYQTAVYQAVVLHFGTSAIPAGRLPEIHPLPKTCEADAVAIQCGTHDMLCKRSNLEIHWARIRGRP